MVDKFPTSLQVRMAHARGPLGRLIGIVGRQHGLVRRLRAALPAPLDSHCVAIEHQDDTLFLVMESPAWAARTRYMSQDILARMADRLQPCPTILKVRAARTTGQPSARPKKKRPSGPSSADLSEQSRRHLLESARAMPDPELKRALERLARKRP